MAPNVLLVVLDSVRASNLGLHGHINETTPFLETFGNRATVYTNARAPSIGSRPSHASLFTGHHASETGISSSNKLQVGTTIWEELRDDGYETAVFSDNPFLRSNRYGFVHGFETIRTRPEHFVDVPFPGGLDPRTVHTMDTFSGIRSALRHDAPIRSLLNGVVVLAAKQSPTLERRLGIAHETSANTYVEELGEWLDGRDGSWAACLNLMDAHYPYEPEAEFDCWGSPILRKLQNDWSESNFDPSAFHEGMRPWWQLRAFEALYDGTIRQLDSAVERIVEVLEEADELNDTLLVVTSDHGEAFGEQSYFDPEYRLVAHGADGGIHDERAHVPLVVKYPGQRTGRRVEAPASLTTFPDVVRAVREGDAGYEEFVPDGPVLVTLDAGYEQAACAVYDEDGDGVRMQTVSGSEVATVVIRDAQIKYKVNECASLAQEFLESFTDRGLSVPQESKDIDQTTREHLADLGYVE